VKRFCGFPHPVDTGLEKLMQHVVFIGSDDQLLNRQTHHACNVSGADIAEITRRYSKRYLLLVIGGRCEIATEIVNNLRDNTCPID
jgi:hypothetical protein